MDFKNSINLLKVERQLLLNEINNLTKEQLLKIPSGYKNNIAWNFGHIIVTQQVLHYMLSRNEMHIPKEMVSMYRTGTSPENWKDQPDTEELKSLLLSLSDMLLDDYDKGLFKSFRPYKTSNGVELNNLEDAITFNHFHEGTHTGIILGLIKQIKDIPGK